MKQIINLVCRTPLWLSGTRCLTVISWTFILILSTSTMKAEPFFESEKALLPEVPGATQNDRKITGHVKDDRGEPLVGATVTVKNTRNITITDLDGNYALENVPAGSTIVFTYIGMTPVEKPVGNQSVLDVVMAEDVIGLEEFTAIGYISMKKKDLTGSVSSLSAEQIARIPANSIATSLVSVPGIRVIDGQIRIRGNRSLKGSNDPLIILDGMPYYESLQSIDPSDIESIDVLKDASSTALYGSQGANGVIIITSKKGKVGKTVVSYDAFAGVGLTNWRKYKVMNADEYMAFKREAYRAAGTWHDESDDNKAFLGNEIANMGLLDEDWMGSYMDKKKFWTSQTVTIASGTEKTQYKIALNYRNDNGRMEGASKNYYYLTTDVDHQVLDYLKVGVSNRLYYNKTKDKSDPFQGLITMSPLTPIYNEDGSYNAIPTGDPFVKNPYLNTIDDYYEDQTEEWKGFIKLYAALDLLDGLTFRTNFSYNQAFSSRGYYWDVRSTKTNDDRNEAGNHNNRQNIMVWNNILNYKKTFADIHSLDVFGVYEIQETKNNKAEASGKDQELSSYKWHNMGRLMDSKKIHTEFKRTQMISYVGRLHYTLMDKYMATITVREDGASQLSKGNRWNFFPSFAAGWRLSEEAFIKKYDFITNLKLRGSYGITGNHSVDPYATLGSLHGYYATFNTDNGETHYVGQEPAIRPTPDLKWETTKMFNIGLDYGFLNGRIYGTVDYYKSKTEDILSQRVLPYTSGFEKAWDNIGKTQNKGWEVTMNTIPVQTKDFQLGVNLSFYRNKEEFVELYDPNITQDVNNGWFIGHPLKGVHYNMEQLGIWQEHERELAAVYGQLPGEVKVRDLDGNGKIDGDDRLILGSNRPDWTGAMQINMEYKDFDFSMDLYGEFGALEYDKFNSERWLSQLGRWNTIKLDYWTPENPTNKYPRPVAGQEIKYMASTGYYKNDYVTFRNITLGYTLPKNLMGKVVKKARFYLTVNEPFKIAPNRRDVRFDVDEKYLVYWETYYLLGVNLQF